MNMRHYSQDDQELDEALANLANLSRDERKRETTWDKLNKEMKKEGNRRLFKYGFRKIATTFPILSLIAGIWWNYEAIMEQLGWEQSGYNYSTSSEELIAITKPIDEPDTSIQVEFEPPELSLQGKKIAIEFTQAFALSLEEYTHLEGDPLMEKANSVEGLANIFYNWFGMQKTGDMKQLLYFHNQEDKGYVLCKKGDGTKDLYTIEKRGESWQVVYFQRLTHDGEYIEREAGMELEKLEAYRKEARFATPHRSAYGRSLPNEIEINEEIYITTGASLEHIMIKADDFTVKIEHPKTKSKLLTAELSKDESILAIEVLQNDNFITIYIVDMINGTYHQVVDNEMSMLPIWGPATKELLLAKGEIGKIKLSMYNPVTKEFSILDGEYYNLISIDWEKEGKFIDFVMEKKNINDQEEFTIDGQQLILYPFALYRYEFTTGNTEKLMDLSVEELKHLIQRSPRNYLENTAYRVQYKGF